MKEVREIYPDRFVKFEVVGSHTEDGKEYIDEVSVIKAIEVGKEVMIKVKRSIL